jgi:hypothetical protein
LPFLSLAIYAITSGAAVVPAGAAPLARQVPPPLPQEAPLLRPEDPERHLQIAAAHGGGRQVERDGHARHRHAGPFEGGTFFSWKNFRFLILSCFSRLRVLWNWWLHFRSEGLRGPGDAQPHAGGRRRGRRPRRRRGRGRREGARHLPRLGQFCHY